MTKRVRIRHPKIDTRCYWCRRQMSRLLIEWHPGVQDWQCVPKELTACRELWKKRLEKK